MPPQSKTDAHPFTQFFNEPLPEEFFDGKGRPLRSVTYATNQGETLGSWFETTLEYAHGDIALISHPVLTAKYTFYNFIPKNLFEQFRRVANIFFLSEFGRSVYPGLPFLTSVILSCSPRHPSVLPQVCHHQSRAGHVALARRSRNHSRKGRLRRRQAAPIGSSYQSPTSPCHDRS